MTTKTNNAMPDAVAQERINVGFADGLTGRKRGLDAPYLEGWLAARQNAHGARMRARIASRGFTLPARAR